MSTKLKDLILEMEDKNKKPTPKKKEKKAKKPSISERIREIETTGNIAALEAKMDALEEVISEYESRVNSVTEYDQDFVNPQAVKEAQNQLKELGKAKGKYQKMYEKLTGKEYTKKTMEEEDID